MSDRMTNYIYIVNFVFIISGINTVIKMFNSPRNMNSLCRL